MRAPFTGGIVIAALLITGPCAMCFVPNMFGHICCSPGQGFLVRAAPDWGNCLELTSRKAINELRVPDVVPLPATSFPVNPAPRQPRDDISSVPAPQIDQPSYLENCALLI